MAGHGAHLEFPDPDDQKILRYRRRDGVVLMPNGEISERGRELAKLLERPERHPQAIKLNTLVFTVLLSVGGSIIGLQVQTTLGRERLSFDVFDDHVGRSGVRYAPIEQPRDIRMVQAGQNAALAGEPGDGLSPTSGGIMLRAGVAGARHSARTKNLLSMTII